MKQNVLESIKHIQKTYNFYVVMLGVVFLGFIIHIMNKAFNFEAGKIILFNFEIRPQYFSLIYGVLFGIFVVILFLEIYLLKMTLNRMKFKKSADLDELAEKIRYFPWIASPFQKAMFGPFLFWFIFGIGFVELAFLVRAHISPTDGSENKCVFVTIGIIDLVILIATLILLGLIIKNVKTINKHIRRL